MNQNTLYRKYRPKDFDTVVGQEHIVTTLKNQIVNNRVSHAYLFCGTRGTGKTTVAKIFARALNCESKKEKDANPCNKCDICNSILNNQDININELDAAANNGIDDIRNIIELTEYPPTNNEKYKVFIIDEAHEISDKAKDAFLKTLEEPPSYVVFILCTTEPQKLKQTILSRCQRYDFKRITIENIIKYLKQISEKENINISNEALRFIAQRADGSMRESISLLDRVQSFNKENIDLQITQEILGISDEHYFKELTNNLMIENVNEIIKIINSLIDEGKEITQLVNDYIWYLRNILLTKNMNEANELLLITKEKFEEYKNFSSKIGTDTLIWYIEKLSETANIMKQDENKRVQLETCFIRMCIPEGDISKEGLINRIEILENKLKNESYYRIDTNQDINEGTKEKNNINKENKKEENTKETKIQSNIEKSKKENQIDDTTLKKIKEDWHEIVVDIHKAYKTLEEVELVASEKTGVVKIISNNFIIDSLFDNKETKDKLKDKTKNILGLDIEYEIVTMNTNNKKDRIAEINERAQAKGLDIIQK